MVHDRYLFGSGVLPAPVIKSMSMPTVSNPALARHLDSTAMYARLSLIEAYRYAHLVFVLNLIMIELR